jgi:stage III sporulation protein AE
MNDIPIINDLSPVLGSQLSQWDLTPLERISFTDWVWRAVNGELDLSVVGLTQTVLHMFFDELFRNGALIRQLLIVAIISAFIKCLSDSFKNKSVGEVGFYVCYLLVIVAAFTSFRMSIGILTDLVTQTTGMMQAAIPLMISLMVMSGNIAGAAVFQPVLMLGITALAGFIAYIFIPLLTAAAVLHIVNYIAEGNIFYRLTLLVKKVAELSLKFMVFVFLSLLALQRISAPILNNLAVSTARAAAGAVPVVGGALTSAVDTVLNLGNAAKSGVLVALVIVICVAVAIPLLKLAAFVFIFKLTAALIQPICDERIVLCIDGLGTFTGYLLGAGALVAVMFVSACVIMLMF